MISKEEIKNLAELARLELKEGETESLQKDISNILDYVGQIAAVPVSGVSETPMNPNVMREDIQRGEDDALAGKEEKIRNAFPSREGEYNVVRKIIQKDE